jgi:hypothetical protein
MSLESEGSVRHEQSLPNVAEGDSPTITKATAADSQFVGEIVEYQVHGGFSGYTLSFVFCINMQLLLEREVSFFWKRHCAIPEVVAPLRFRTHEPSSKRTNYCRL